MIVLLKPAHLVILRTYEDAAEAVRVEVIRPIGGVGISFSAKELLDGFLPPTL